MKKDDFEARYTRRQAAKLLGVSYDTVIRAQRKGKIVAERDKRGHWRISLPAITVFANKRGTPLRPSNEGTLAASIFEMFDAGRAFHEVVRATKIAPAQVMELYRQFRNGYAELGLQETVKQAEKENAAHDAAMVEFEANRAAQREIDEQKRALDAILALELASLSNHRGGNA